MDLKYLFVALLLLGLVFSVTQPPGQSQQPNQALRTAMEDAKLNTHNLVLYSSAGILALGIILLAVAVLFHFIAKLTEIIIKLAFVLCGLFGLLAFAIGIAGIAIYFLAPTMIDSYLGFNMPSVG
jgi:hypothetical protein